MNHPQYMSALSGLNEDKVEEMMDDPFYASMIEELLKDPETMVKMMEENPVTKKLMDSNPMMKMMMSNPETLKMIISKDAAKLRPRNHEEDEGNEEKRRTRTRGIERHGRIRRGRRARQWGGKSRCCYGHVQSDEWVRLATKPRNAASFPTKSSSPATIKLDARNRNQSFVRRIQPVFRHGIQSFVCFACSFYSGCDDCESS